MIIWPVYYVLIHEHNIGLTNYGVLVLRFQAGNEWLVYVATG